MTDTAKPTIVSASAALFGAPSTDGNAPAPSAPAQAAAGDDAPLTLNIGLTAEKTRHCIELDVKEGKLSREKANELLAADGLAPLGEAGALSEEAKMIDQGFPPAKKITDFKMPPLADANGNVPPEVLKVDLEVRHWLLESRLPAEIGTSLAREAKAVGERVAKMSEPERATWAQQEVGMVQKLYGANYETMLAGAQALVREIEEKRPGLVAFLEETGLGNSSWVITTFANQAARLKARQGIA